METKYRFKNGESLSINYKDGIMKIDADEDLAFRHVGGEDRVVAINLNTGETTNEHINANSNDKPNLKEVNKLRKEEGLPPKTKLAKPSAKAKIEPPASLVRLREKHTKLKESYSSEAHKQAKADLREAKKIAKANPTKTNQSKVARLQSKVEKFEAKKTQLAEVKATLKTKEQAFADKKAGIKVSKQSGNATKGQGSNVTAKQSNTTNQEKSTSAGEQSQNLSAEEKWEQWKNSPMTDEQIKNLSTEERWTELVKSNAIVLGRQRKFREAYEQFFKHLVDDFGGDTQKMLRDTQGNKIFSLYKRCKKDFADAVDIDVKIKGPRLKSSYLEQIRNREVSSDERLLAKYFTRKYQEKCEKSTNPDDKRKYENAQKILRTINVEDIESPVNKLRDYRKLYWEADDILDKWQDYNPKDKDYKENSEYQFELLKYSGYSTAKAKKIIQERTEKAEFIAKTVDEYKEKVSCYEFFDPIMLDVRIRKSQEE